MPYIPLPRPNTQLARPQVPALDHLERPQIDARRVLAAMGELGRASGMPGVEAGPFIEAAGAQGHMLGRALQDSSELLAALGAKQQQERDRAGMFRASELLDAGGAEAAGYFASNPQKTHSWLGVALRIGGRVVKGLGEITGLSEVGHQRVQALGAQWHQGLLANTQAAVIKQDLRNSAEAQVGHVRGLLKQGDVRGAHAMLAPIAQSGVVEPEVMRDLEGQVRTMGARQDEARALSLAAGPGLDLTGGHETVAQSVYIPKERKAKLMARLTHVHAAASQEAYVLNEMEKDPAEAVKLLEDHGQVTQLSPRVRQELRREAVERREAAGEEGYVRSREYVDVLEAEKLAAMTPEELDAAMSGGDHAWEWKQAGVFHKALAGDYLALKQGKEKLDDPARQLALEAAIDRYVPDMDEAWRGRQMRLMIEEGFGEEKERGLLERLDARVKGKAKVPAVTARAREQLYQWAYQNGAASGGEVRQEVDRETQVMSRQLDERAARGEFKSSQDSVEFIRNEAGARGWSLEGEDAGEEATTRSATGGAMRRPVVPVALEMKGAQDASKGREPAPPVLAGPGPEGGGDAAGELRREQGIYMPAPLRAKADEMVREVEDNFDLIEAPDDVREALEANIAKTRRAYEELRITFPEGSEEFETAARGIDAVHEKERAAILDAYRHKAEEPKRRVNQVLDDPAFKELPPQQRAERLEQVLSEAANAYHGKWDRGTWMDWTDFSARAWERAAPSAMETAKDAGSKVVHGVGRMFVDIPRSFRDQGAAIWDEAETYTKTGKHGKLARTGKDAFEAQFLQWDAAAGQFFNRVLTDDQKPVNEAIGRFFASVDTGEFLDDPTALQKAADEVTQAQLAWWGKMAPVTTEVSADGNTYIERRPVGALQWGMQEKEAARRNGVFAPDNAMLLYSYMTTHNPALKEQLRSQLLRTPDVIYANDKLDAAMKSPGAQAYEAIHGKGTAANFVSAMDPVTVVGNVALAGGAIKGALGVARAVAGEAAGASAAREFAKGTARSSALMGTLGAAGVIKDDPNASPGAILAGGAEGATTGALFHSALAAAGFTGGKVFSKMRGEETKPGLSTSSSGDKSDIVTPFNPPPGTMMLDLTFGLGRTIHVMAREAREFGPWSMRMAERFGDWVKPHLENLWVAGRRDRDSVTEYLRTKLTDDERKSLKLPTEARDIPPLKEPPKALPLHVATEDFDAVREGKGKLGENMDLQETRAFVERHYNDKAFGGLGDRNTVFVPVPSTSGKNHIPRLLAEKMKSKLDGSIVLDPSQFKLGHNLEGKKLKGYIKNAESPRSFKFRDPEAMKKLLAGKRVVFVDDIMTSGETLDALALPFESIGVKPHGVATLAAVDGGRVATPGEVSNLAVQMWIQSGKPRDLAKVKEDVRLVFGESRARLVSEVLGDLKTDPKRVHELVSEHAEAIRDAIRRGNEPPKKP